jgi:hypothetical protein
MRGAFTDQGQLFSYISPEARVRTDHSWLGRGTESDSAVTPSPGDHCGHAEGPHPDHARELHRCQLAGRQA